MTVRINDMNLNIKQSLKASSFITKSYKHFTDKVAELVFYRLIITNVR